MVFPTRYRVLSGGMKMAMLESKVTNNILDVLLVAGEELGEFMLTGEEVREWCSRVTINFIRSYA